MTAPRYIARPVAKVATITWGCETWQFDGSRGAKVLISIGEAVIHYPRAVAEKAWKYIAAHGGKIKPKSDCPDRMFFAYVPAHDRIRRVVDSIRNGVIPPAPMPLGVFLPPASSANWSAEEWEMWHEAIYPQMIDDARRAQGMEVR